MNNDFEQNLIVGDKQNILPEKLKNNHGLIFFLYVFLTILLFTLFFLLYKNDIQNKTSINTEVYKPAENKIFNNLILDSRAVMVWDVSKGEEIYSRNAEAQLPLASLTKVMMAVTALSLVSEETTITIQNEDLLEEGDSGLKLKENWTLGDLIDFILIVSSNDGAMAVANTISSQIKEGGTSEDFVEMMNRKASEIGLSQTYFTSPSGLDNKNIIAGGVGSVRDMVILFEYTMKNFPHSMEVTTYPSLEVISLDSFKHKARNTNDLVGKLPGLTASKTGFTDLAGGNLVVAFEPEPGRTIVLAVLGSTQEGRFSDIEKLYLTTLDYLNLKIKPLLGHIIAN